MASADWDLYVTELIAYLGVLEARLFSEGLHILGERPPPAQIVQYLDAYFDGSLPPEAILAISELDTSDKSDPKAVLASLFVRLTELGSLTGFGDIAPDLGTKEPPYHWYNSLSNEEKYSLTLYGLDVFRFYSLKIRRALGDKEAAKEIVAEVAVAFGTEQDQGVSMQVTREKRDDLQSKLLEAIEIKKLLEQNTEELRSIVKALNGEYVLPGVGGDLLRDGTGVLPTGRNIHALDPYRMPSPAAYIRSGKTLQGARGHPFVVERVLLNASLPENMPWTDFLIPHRDRGKEAARKVIEQHLAKEGTYPETVAVMLWGLDAIKTRGESVAILLALVRR